MDYEDELSRSSHPSKKLIPNAQAPIETGTTIDVRYQAGSDALEVLSRTSGTRLHFLGIIV